MTVLDYVAQPNGYTCQSAAICRVIGSYSVMGVRYQLDTIAESMGSIAGDPAVMAKYLNQCVTDGKISAYQFVESASLNMAIAASKKGDQLITHSWLTDAGHVFGISGWDPATKKYKTEDPYGEFSFPEWQYVSEDGDDRSYSALAIYAACVASYSVDQAIQIYQDGKVDYDEKNMWLHIITP
jgi:hypothetical protein